MTYTEIQQNLFDAPADYALAHCISADFALGAGIARQFQSRFGTRDELKERCHDYKFIDGDCLGTGTRDTRAVFNLVTKAHFWEKPTYKSLEEALITMRFIAYISGYNKIAMPKIGCGLDGLKWSKVKTIIHRVFETSDVDILICYI